MNEILGFIFLVFGLYIYLLPSIYAEKKKHPAKNAIIITNILGGLLYGIGWIISLVWVFNGAENRKTVIVADDKSTHKNSSIADEIKNLHKLKEDNIISEEEFESKKKQLLNS